MQFNFFSDFYFNRSKQMTHFHFNLDAFLILFRIHLKIFISPTTQTENLLRYGIENWAIKAWSFLIVAHTIRCTAQKRSKNLKISLADKEFFCVLNFDLNGVSVNGKYFSFTFARNNRHRLKRLDHDFTMSLWVTVKLFYLVNESTFCLNSFILWIVLVLIFKASGSFRNFFKID